MEPVHEGVAADVRDSRGGLLSKHHLADGLEQMRLAKTHATMDEEGVVCPTQLSTDRHRRRVRQAIARPDHERIEAVVGAQDDLFIQEW
jgi:hypothetical protein